MSTVARLYPKPQPVQLRVHVEGEILLGTRTVTFRGGEALSIATVPAEMLDGDLLPAKIRGVDGHRALVELPVEPDRGPRRVMVAATIVVVTPAER